MPDLRMGIPKRSESRDAVQVLNGIAYDELNDRFFVTGKCWPKLYEIEVSAPGGPGGGRRARATQRASSNSFRYTEGKGSNQGKSASW